MRPPIAIALLGAVAIGAATLALIEARSAEVAASPSPSAHANAVASGAVAAPRSVAVATAPSPLVAVAAEAPPTADARLATARRLEVDGAWTEAESEYRAALEDDAASTAARVGLGRVLRRRSPLQSEEALKRAVELDANDAEAHLELAVTESHLLAYDEARRHAEMALRLDPHGPRAPDLIDLVAFINNVRASK